MERRSPKLRKQDERYVRSSLSEWCCDVTFPAYCVNALKVSVDGFVMMNNSVLSVGRMRLDRRQRSACPNGCGWPVCPSSIWTGQSRRSRLSDEALQILLKAVSSFKVKDSLIVFYCKDACVSLAKLFKTLTQYFSLLPL